MIASYIADTPEAEDMVPQKEEVWPMYPAKDIKPGKINLQRAKDVKDEA